MDWGLSKVLVSPPREEGSESVVTEIKQDRESNHHTQAGDALGTPAFMPSEQALGTVDQMTPRSDVFGLGGILCMLLTGKPPFLGGDAISTKLLAAAGKIDDAYTRLDGCNADPELIALAKHCLAAEPNDRMASGSDVAQCVASLRVAAEEKAKQIELEAARAEILIDEQITQVRASS